MTWTIADTNTHQDHVIAHVIGATPLGHFVWDETAFIVLDIGFIWNIYLDMEMGLLPQGLAIAELEADEAKKNELRSYVEQLTQGVAPVGAIKSVELFVSEDARRLVLDCEDGSLFVETDTGHRYTRIIANASVA